MNKQSKSSLEKTKPTDIVCDPQNIFIQRFKIKGFLLSNCLLIYLSVYPHIKVSEYFLTFLLEH